METIVDFARTAHALDLISRVDLQRPTMTSFRSTTHFLITTDILPFAVLGDVADSGGVSPQCVQGDSLAQFKSEALGRLLVAERWTIQAIEFETVRFRPL